MPVRSTALKKHSVQRQGMFCCLWDYEVCPGAALSTISLLVLASSQPENSARMSESKQHFPSSSLSQPLLEYRAFRALFIHIKKSIHFDYNAVFNI